MSAGPLEGVKVVDFTENMAGPFGTMILGDQGANVVKVEPPGGDIVRSRGSGRGGVSGYFANLNRSKRSVVLDLQHSGSKVVLDRLLDWADVAVTSLRPTAARKLGIDVRSMTEGRPQLICAAVVGFGTSGPLAGLPVYDHVVQALSGIADCQSDLTTGAPDLVHHGIIDKTTGHVLAQSVCAALVRRFLTGTGAELTISMLDVGISLLWPDGMMDHTVAEPEVSEPPIAKSFRLTPTADGHVALVVMTGSQWEALISALGLQGDPQDRAQILKQARMKIKKMTGDRIVELLASHDVPCARVVEVEDVHRHPQVRANDTLFESTHPVLGRIRQPRPVPSFSQIDAGTLRPSPKLGEHSQEVLEELGLDQNEIAQLVGNKVVVPLVG